MKLVPYIQSKLAKLLPKPKLRGYQDLVKRTGQNADRIMQSLSDDADLWQNAYALTARVRDLFKTSTLYQKYRELIWVNCFGSNGHMLRMKITETEPRVIHTPDEKHALIAYEVRYNRLREHAAKMDGKDRCQYRAYKLADAMERSKPEDILTKKATIQIGDPDVFANQAFEKGWATWGRKEFSDMRGTRNYFQQCLLRLIGAVRDGDFFIRMIRDPKINKFGFTLHMISAEWCDRFLNTELPNGNVIIMGIEYEMTPWGLGKVVAYYFITRTATDWQFQTGAGLFGYGSPSAFHQRIDAADIIHYGRPVDAAATRPAPWVAATIPKGRQLDQYELYEVIAAREHARRVGYLWSDVHPEGGMAGVEIDPRTGLAAAQGAEPGDTIALPNGVQFKESDPKHPSQNFETFRKGMVRSITAGMPASDYSTLANDLENINFSAGRLGRLDTNEMSMLIQRFDIDVAERPIFEAWQEMAIVTGAIPFPLVKLEKFRKAVFQGRRWAQVDEVKAEQASAMRISNNKSSWGIECALDGKDFEEVLTDKAENIMLMEQYGISPSTTADSETSQTNSDAASGPDGGDVINPIDSIKGKFDAYGVGVRAGAITPQPDDENAFRDEAGLPKVSKDVTRVWKEEGNVRRPITLKYGDEVQVPSVNGTNGTSEDDAADSAADKSFRYSMNRFKHPKKKTVSVLRDSSGRITGAETEESE